MCILPQFFENSYLTHKAVETWYTRKKEQEKEEIPTTVPGSACGVFSQSMSG